MWKEEGRGEGVSGGRVGEEGKSSAVLGVNGRSARRSNMKM